MRQTFLRLQLVEFIPEHLEAGIFYVSQRYRTATHRCCCGCGEEVVTPLGPTDWSLQIIRGTVTLFPSIGNWSLSCRSHYWIRNGKVVWAGSMTKKQIAYGRVLDQRMRDSYFAGANTRKDGLSDAPPPQQAKVPHQQSNWIDAPWRAFKKWLGMWNM